MKLSVERTTLVIRSVDDIDTPPGGHLAVDGQLDEEEDGEGGEGEPDVESGGGDVVVLHPPASEFIADVLLEDPAD